MSHFICCSVLCHREYLQHYVKHVYLGYYKPSYNETCGRMRLENVFGQKDNNEGLTGTSTFQ